MLTRITQCSIKAYNSSAFLEPEGSLLPVSPNSEGVASVSVSVQEWRRGLRVWPLWFNAITVWLLVVSVSFTEGGVAFVPIIPNKWGVATVPVMTSKQHVHCLLISEKGVWPLFLSFLVNMAWSLFLSISEKGAWPVCDVEGVVSLYFSLFFFNPR